MDEILKNVANKLCITQYETQKIVKKIFEKETYQEDLLELLGFENIDLIEQLCENRDLYLKNDNELESTKFYIEYCLPEYKTITYDEESLVDVNCTNEDAKYFDYKKFNPVQSKVFDCVYNSDFNFLVSAPTGSGKTDIALLSILRALKNPNAKVAYLVPMKALATEISNKLKHKLKNYNVIEYTGDTEHSFHELLTANVIICTPEKFDAHTRKLSNVFSDSLTLMILDEIHILHEDRGSVLESIVSRVFRYIEIKQRYVRIIGLSATLPNFEDVGSFLKTDKIYNFDQRYRPVPLKTSIIGMFKSTTKKQSDLIFVEMINKFRHNKKQVLIFVTTRRDTIVTAKLLVENDNIEDNSVKPNLSGQLDFLLSHRIGVHHAGLPRNIRLHMEQTFKTGKIDILVCTSTLAWGVNLPAHAVIIKGTTFYDPTIGKFTDMGILDIYQIFGRAGRPQYKITGEAVLITEYSKVEKYLRMIKNNEIIESRLLRHLVSVFNSEIYLNNINSVSDGLKWFKNTFMYVRLKRNPAFYGMQDNNYDNKDTVLSEYLYLSVKKLEDLKLINIYKKDINVYTIWKFHSTEFGRISSFFYLDHETTFEWLKSVDFLCTQDDIIRLLVKTKDFSNIQDRKEEEYNLMEMATQMGLLLDNNEVQKLYILAVASFKKYPVVNFNLKCDFNFISKNLERILSAFCEFLLFLKRWNILFTSLELLQKLLLKKNITKNRPQASNDSLKIDVKYCGDFLRISVEYDSAKEFWLIAYDDNNCPFYITKGLKTICKYVKLNKTTNHDSNTCILGSLDSIKRDERPVDSKNESSSNLFLSTNAKKLSKSIKIGILDVVNDKFIVKDYQIEYSSHFDFFLQTGFHFCYKENKKFYLLDFNIDCKHINLENKTDFIYKSCYGNIFNLNIDFFVSYNFSYKEFLISFVNTCMGVIQKNNRVIMICRSKNDIKFLAQEIKTRIAIYTYETGIEIKRSICYDIQKIRNNSICLVILEDAMHKCNIFTILLGCKHIFNQYYSMHNLIQICNNRHVIIYEDEEFIDYFKQNILREDQ